jgi:PKD repeat protein
LTVSGPGGSDTLTRAGYIVVYRAVDADFYGTPTSGLGPLTVAFTNTSTGDYTSSSWWFGDGTTSSDKNPSHTYPNAGTYKVTLTVSGPGGSDTLQRPNYVTVLAGRAHVSGIVLTYQRISGKYKVTAKVSIVDQNNQVVPGATVYVTWTLPNSSNQSQQALTNTSGVAQFSVQSTLTGIYKICVTNVAKTNWTYDPGQNIETCDTKTVP